MVIKRCFDLLFSITGLIVLSPLLIVVSVIIFFEDGNPVLFKQERPGKDEKLFYLLKFRTMKNLNDVKEEAQEDKFRITRLGNFLRKTSIDELPTLINVIKGDMSIVGPRPLLKEYLPLYSKEQKLRHIVKPGITGWAQINGRNLLDWNEKFKLDVWYVRNRSLILDVKIIFISIFKVLKKEGISQRGEATMKKFGGNN